MASSTSKETIGIQRSILENGAENPVCNVDNRSSLDSGCIVDGNIPRSRICKKLAQWNADSGNGDNNSPTYFVLS